MIRGIAGAVFRKIKADNPVGAEIAGDGLSLIFLRKLRAIDDFQSGEFREIPRARALHNAAAAGIGEIHRPGNGIADALKSGTIGDEGLAVAIEVVSPRIAPTAVLNAGLLRIRPKPHNAATLETHDAVWCFQVAANVNGLVKVKPPIVSPAKGVQSVVGVFGAEAGQHNALFIGLTVAVGVLEMQQLRALADITSAIARLNGGWNKQAFGKDLRLVRAPIAGGVLQHHDFVIGHLAGLHLRINLRGRYPKAALRIEIHLDRLGQRRVLGEEGNLHTFSGIEFRQRLRVADGFLRQRRIGGGLEFEITARGDFLFLSNHQRIKARNLDGVVALFVFPEAEYIGHVLRPRAIKEELVLPCHDRAQLGGRRRIQLRMRRHAELLTDLRRHAGVAAGHWVDAVFGQGRFGVHQRIGIKQGHEEIPLRRRHRLKFLGIGSELAIVHGRIRQTSAQMLMAQG